MNKKDLQSKAKKLRHNLTRAELKLWQRIRNKQLSGFKFRCQHIIAPYIVDFYSHRAKLVIEVDGNSHLTKKEDDLKRDNWLKKQNLKIMRFSNNEVYEDIEKVKLYCKFIII